MQCLLLILFQMAKMELSNITQPILLYCDVLGLPTIIGNIF